MKLARNATSAISLSVAPLTVAAAVCMSVQYGHFMFAAMAKPMNSRYLAGISDSPIWYFFMSGQSCIKTSFGMAFMKPGTKPRVFSISFNVCAYSSIIVHLPFFDLSLTVND